MYCCALNLLVVVWLLKREFDYFYIVPGTLRRLVVEGIPSYYRSYCYSVYSKKF